MKAIAGHAWLSFGVGVGTLLGMATPLHATDVSLEASYAGCGGAAIAATGSTQGACLEMPLAAAGPHTSAAIVERHATTPFITHTVADLTAKAVPLKSEGPTATATVLPRTADAFQAQAAAIDPTITAIAAPLQDAHADAIANANPIDVDPQVIEDSPVLRRWLQDIPDIADDIRRDPALRTRLRVGYSRFPSTAQTNGFQIGVQDIFVGRTPLTLSADYGRNGRGDRESYGIDAQYYLLPLGWYGNLAPVVGYRSIDTPDFATDGLNLGFRVIVIPSRTGAADISFTQTWVRPGSSEEVGVSTLSVGYAVTRNLRIATDIQKQNTPARQDSRVSLLLEWMP